MNRLILAVSASMLALAIASPAIAGDAPQPAASASKAQAAQPGATIESATPTMSFGTWGVDTKYLATDVDPGDDFFAFANQRWIDANPLPAEFARFGAFNLLGEKATVDVQGVVADLQARRASLSAEERRIVDGYEAFMDTAAID